MSHEQSNTSDKKYYTVFADAFRTKVPEGHPEAMQRINKLGKQVTEREVKALFGRIEDVFIEDSDYGKQIKIVLDKNEDEEHPVVSFAIESKHGRDVLKKLPGVNFTKPVRIMPYRFKPADKETEISGISISQQDENDKYTVKVENFFFDAITKKYLHDFPTIDWDAASESEQKIYKIKRDEFLLGYFKEHVLPIFSEKPEPVGTPEEETARPEDIPF